MISPFDYFRPTTVGEASAALLADDDAVFYAGGTELLVLMKNRLVEPRLLIDLKHIPGLRGVRREGDVLVIGGLTTHREMERSDLVAQSVPELRRVSSMVANVRVRHAGTIAGNLCFAEPHSDPATMLVGLRASVVLQSVAGMRELPLEEFFTGFLSTARERDEVLSEIRVPIAQGDQQAAYERFKSHERPDASVAIVTESRDGVITSARVVAGCVGDVPQRVTQVESVLVGARADALDVGALAALARDAVEVDADPMMSAEYKQQLVATLTQRALARIAASRSEAA